MVLRGVYKRYPVPNSADSSGTTFIDKNPKYWSSEKSEGPTIKKKVLMCNVPVRDANKELVKVHTRLFKNC